MKIGTQLSKTIDFCTSPGIITLLYRDEKVVQKDYLNLTKMTNVR